MTKLNIDIIKNKNNLTYEETKFLQNAYFKSTVLLIFTAVFMMIVVLVLTFALHIHRQGLEQWKEIASRARWNEGTAWDENKKLKARVEKLEQDQKSYQRIAQLAQERGDTFEDALCVYAGFKSACKTPEEKAIRQRMRDGDPKCTYKSGVAVCESVSYPSLPSRKCASPSVGYSVLGGWIGVPRDPDCINQMK